MAEGHQLARANQPPVRSILADEVHSSDHARGVNGARRQAHALQREGVRVENGPMGEYTVSLSEFGWFPTRLPSEADQVEDSESSDSVEDDAPLEPPRRGNQ